MKLLPAVLDPLLTVAAAVLDTQGVLLEANAGFLRLLPQEMTKPIGARVARFFIQPGFADFAAHTAAADSAGREIHSGLMTIGDYGGRTRSLRGRVWRTAAGIRVLAEYDIDELEGLADAMITLNRESSLAQQTLTRTNLVLKQREARFVEDSLTDALTGTGNRRRLDQALAAEISRARRDSGPLSAIMADIDYFKRINDEYGHAAGDKVLAHFAGLLRSRTRPTDTVARFGGEEFVVLLPHTGLAQAVAKAEQFRIALAAQIVAPLARPVTSSFGVAEHAIEEDAESLLGRIDAALYEAKKGGRNRVFASSARRLPPSPLPAS